MRSGQGEPGRFNRALGQDPALGQVPGTCCTGVCVAQLFWEADARQIGMQTPSENPAQETGMASRREEEPSDIDVGLISGPVAKRKDWRG